MRVEVVRADDLDRRNVSSGLEYRDIRRENGENRRGKVHVGEKGDLRPQNAQNTESWHWTNSFGGRC